MALAKVRDNFSFLKSSEFFHSTESCHLKLLSMLLTLWQFSSFSDTMLSIFLYASSVCSSFPLSPVSMRFFQDSGHVLPTWWSLSGHSPFPGRFDPFFLCPPCPFYSCVLLLQLPKNFVPVFVSTVSLLLPGGRSLRQRLGVYVSSISLI